MTRLLLVSGSLRQDAWNTRLLHYLAEPLHAEATLDVLLPSEVTLPLFDQDLEHDPLLRPALLAVHQRFAACDGLLIASPEYNGQPTAYLKNLIDWVSRLSYLDSGLANPFHGKPVLLCSATTGWSGGAQGLQAARSLFAYLGALVLGETITVAHVDQTWDGERFQFDPFFADYLFRTSQRLSALAGTLSHS